MMNHSTTAFCVNDNFAENDRFYFHYMESLSTTLLALTTLSKWLLVWATLGQMGDVFTNIGQVIPWQLLKLHLLMNLKISFLHWGIVYLNRGLS